MNGIIFDPRQIPRDEEQSINCEQQQAAFMAILVEQEINRTPETTRAAYNLRQTV